MVNHAFGHFKVKLMKDSIMAAIPILQTSMFVMSNPRNFTFIGSIPEEMLMKVPHDNAIVNAYRKSPSSSIRLMTDELRKEKLYLRKQLRT